MCRAGPPPPSSCPGPTARFWLEQRPLHTARAVNPQHELAKCLNMLRTTDGWPLVIRNPRALCRISQVICGGEHLNSVVLGNTSVGACWHARDAEGQKQPL